MRQKLSGEFALLERALRTNYGFSEWPADVMQGFLPRCSLESFTKGETVSDFGDTGTACVVVSGYLLIFYGRPDGSFVALNLIGPGSVMGLVRGMASVQRPSYGLRAHSDVIVVKFSTAKLIAVLDENPTLWKSLVRSVSEECVEKMMTLFDIRAGSISQRIAATLKRLGESHGERSGNSVKLKVKISQQDLAFMLQLTRQTIHKELKLLEAQGIVSANYRGFAINDCEALDKIISTPIQPSGGEE